MPVVRSISTISSFVKCSLDTIYPTNSFFEQRNFTYSRTGKIGKLVFLDSNLYYAIYFVTEESELVHRVEIVSKGCLIRKDYFTYGRVFSEYYAPLDKKAHMYLRRFFNENGTVAYEEINDDGEVMYSSSRLPTGIV